jgi:hypothetical protein
MTRTGRGSGTSTERDRDRRTRSVDHDITTRAPTGRAFVVSVAGIRLVVRIERKRRTLRCGDRQEIIACHCAIGLLRLLASA